MNGALIVVLLSLASALAFAVSTTLKKASAADNPHSPEDGLAALGRFGRATIAHPLWLGGIAADVIGVTLQVTALHLGAIAVVQPLMVTGLLFALLMRPREEGRIDRREMCWAALLAGCLIALLTLSGSLSTATHAAADRLPAVLVATIGAVMLILALSTARRRIPAAGRTALIGVALGAVYAGTAALIKAATAVWSSGGLLAVVASWELYAIVVLAAGGLLLAQVAFRTGPLTASLPATSTVDPLLSILVGVVVYDERLRSGPLDGAVLLSLLVLLATSIVMIARSGAERAMVVQARERSEQLA